MEAIKMLERLIALAYFQIGLNPKRRRAIILLQGRCGLEVSLDKEYDRIRVEFRKSSQLRKLNPRENNPRKHQELAAAILDHFLSAKFRDQTEFATELEGLGFPTSTATMLAEMDSQAGAE